jgi:sigma-E factor negative regulatory protein RseC
MIEERAQVLSISDDNQVWVETERQSTCGACAANKGCGTAVLGKVFGARQMRVQARSQIPLQVGDEVIIGVAEDALVKGSLAVYVVPLLMMFMGALSGKWLSGSEHMSVLMGLLGLLVGFAWLRIFGLRIRGNVHFQPVVVRLYQSKGAVSEQQITLQ